jgi:hypothetical protein
MKYALPETLLLAVLALLSGSCGLLPLNAAGVERPSGSVLFQDEFSDPSSGWDRRPQDPAGFLDYSEGVYRIQAIGVEKLVWAGPDLTFTDAHFEVEATRVAGPEDDDFGLVCRAVDPANFYFFAISSDGYYGIGKVRDGVPELVGMAAMPPSEAIRQGNDRNHLRAECVGENLSLYVNGILLAVVQDAEFSAGETGLFVGTFETSGSEVHFDNFAVLQP